MQNLIETASIFQEELDKAAVATATSGWMELNTDSIIYNGGSEIKIPSMKLDGLGDYEADGDGFAEGVVNLTYETKKMSMDRGRKFELDAKYTNETNFVAKATTIMGEFQRTKVIPEIDAYRYSTLGAILIEGKKASGGYVPDENTILKRLYYDIAAVKEVLGEVPLVITINGLLLSMISMSDKISKKLDVTDFSKGDMTFKVSSLDGIHPLIGVGGNLLKTEYLFKDGRTGDQKVGGFSATEAAKDINWIIAPKNTPIAVSRTDNMRIFDPETYQKKHAWAMDYRKYHDIWIPKNKVDQCFVNLKQALV